MIATLAKGGQALAVGALILLLGGGAAAEGMVKKNRYETGDATKPLEPLFNTPKPKVESYSSREPEHRIMPDTIPLSSSAPSGKPRKPPAPLGSTLGGR